MNEFPDEFENAPVGMFDYNINQDFQPGLAKLIFMIPELKVPRQIFGNPRNPQVLGNCTFFIKMNTDGNLGYIRIINKKKNETKRYKIKFDSEDVGSQWFGEPYSFYTAKKGKLQFYLKKLERH